MYQKQKNIESGNPEITQPQIAVIWDMDGVIIDSEPQHCDAWRTTFKNNNVYLTEEQYQQFAGRRDSDTIRHFMGQDVSDAIIARVSDQKQATFRDLVAKRIVALPGVISLIHSLYSKRVNRH